jgi:transposase
MLALADLFVEVYVRIDDAIGSGAVAIPPRPGPRPACSDAEVLTLAVVRHVLARRSERRFLTEVRREWRHYFPHLPAQSEFNRRVRWLWGAFELLRQHYIATVLADTWQQIDTSALPVKHPSRHRGPEPQWDGPNELRAGFGRDAAHGEWFFGFRLAVRTDLGRRLVRAWSLVPAAVEERRVAEELLDGVHDLTLLLDRGFVGRAFAAWCAARRIRVVVAPSKAERPRLPVPLRQGIAAWRNRVETTFGEITAIDGLQLAWHGAHTFWGLLTRTAATLLAHTLLRLDYV